MKAKNTFFISVGAVVLAVVLGIAGIFYFRLKNISENNPIVVEEEAGNPSVNQQTIEVETPTQPGPNDFPEDFEIQDLTSSLGGEKIVVDWYKGAKPAAEEEYQKIIYAHDPWMKEINDKKENNCFAPDQLSKEQPQNRLPCPVYLYQAGVIRAPKVFEGQTLYLMLAGVEDLGFWYNDFFGVYDDKTSKLITFVENENSIGWLTDLSYKFGRFSGGYLQESSIWLKPPQIIEISGHDILLKWRGAFSIDSSPIGKSSGASQNLGGIYDVANGGVNMATYNLDDEMLSSIDGIQVYFAGRTYRIQLADGAVHLYDLIPYFFHTGEFAAGKDYFPSSFVANIVWTNGNNKADEYVLGGDIKLVCGMHIDTKTNIVNKKDWFSEKNLIEIGKTSKGEKIYEMSDKRTNIFYKELFDAGFEGSQVLGYHGGDYDSDAIEELKKIPEDEKYRQFIADTPIFFWQDDFGNWRVYFKSKYRSLAECGKPVIYLYPEKEMDVKVKVKPNGGFTKTEPAYNNGWVVRATPWSDLFNYADKTNYPYLFWEGHAYGFSIDPTRGFVMAKADVGAEMARILSKLGLNEKETKDFLEFWQPKLEIKPYVFVTFVPQSEFNKAAPMSVNPKPDTIIRVFMDYTPLDAPINTAPLQIKTPERKGFTVVEWGGRLR